MSKICADNNSDCCIDCKGSGFAYYIKPYGPCITDCGDSFAGDMLVSIFNKGGHSMEYSINMRHVSARALGEFSENYRGTAPEESKVYLDEIELVGRNNPDLKFTIICSATSVSDAILQIAAATSERGQNQLSAEA